MIELVLGDDVAQDWPGHDRIIGVQDAQLHLIILGSALEKGGTFFGGLGGRTVEMPVWAFCSRRLKARLEAAHVGEFCEELTCFGAGGLPR